MRPAVSTHQDEMCQYEITSKFCADFTSLLCRWTVMWGSLPGTMHERLRQESIPLTICSCLTQESILGTKC